MLCVLKVVASLHYCSRATIGPFTHSSRSSVLFSVTSFCFDRARPTAPRFIDHINSASDFFKFENWIVIVALVDARKKKKNSRISAKKREREMRKGSHFLLWRVASSDDNKHGREVKVFFSPFPLPHHLLCMSPKKKRYLARDLKKKANNFIDITFALLMPRVVSALGTGAKVTWIFSFFFQDAQYNATSWPVANLPLLPRPRESDSFIS